MRGQLFIGEQLKEIQRFLARCSQIRYKCLHTVFVVSIDVALIPLYLKYSKDILALSSEGI